MGKETSKMDEDYFEKCWELADKSPCSKMKFGSVIVKKGEIIGSGFNHPAHSCIEELCDPCIRSGVKSSMLLERCTAVHAEQAAIINAFTNGYSDLSDAVLYVAGKFPDGRKLIKTKPGLYCSFCSRIIAESGIKEVMVPTVDGAASMTIEEVLKTSYEFALGKRDVKSESSQK